MTRLYLAALKEVYQVENMERHESTYSIEELEQANGQTKEMKTLKLFIRVLLIPVWITIFFIYLFIWYIQMSWYYFDFDDYWESYLLLWDKIMVKLKIK